VRPLAGGFQKWKSLGYTLVEAQVVAWPSASRVAPSNGSLTLSQD
jgi:hypothetical protein